MVSQEKLTASLRVNVTPSDFARLAAKAKANDRSLAAEIRRAIREALREEE